MLPRFLQWRHVFLARAADELFDLQLRICSIAKWSGIFDEVVVFFSDQEMMIDGPKHIQTYRTIKTIPVSKDRNCLFRGEGVGNVRTAGRLPSKVDVFTKQICGPFLPLSRSRGEQKCRCPPAGVWLGAFRYNEAILRVRGLKQNYVQYRLFCVLKSAYEYTILSRWNRRFDSKFYVHVIYASKLQTVQYVTHTVFMDSLIFEAFPSWVIRHLGGRPLGGTADWTLTTLLFNSDRNAETWPGPGPDTTVTTCETSITLTLSAPTF